MKGHAFSPDTVWQRQFEEAFDYEETPDQLRCVEEIKQDMESEVIMDRLLCGDVVTANRSSLKGCIQGVMDGSRWPFWCPPPSYVPSIMKTLKAIFRIP